MISLFCSGRFVAKASDHSSNVRRCKLILTILQTNNYLTFNISQLSLSQMKTKSFPFSYLFSLIALLCGFTVYKFSRQEFVSSLSYQNQEITVVRGDHNIAEIHAKSFRSALYAWGYVTAQDRLFQLAFKRISVRGQLSKYFGNKTIEVDKMFRQVNFDGWARKSTERFLRQNESQYRNFQAYAKGINDYFSRLTFKPIQFYLIGLEWQEWTVRDMLAIYKLMKWALSTGLYDQYIRSSLLSKFTKQEIDQFLPYNKEKWMKGEHSTQSTIIKEDQIPQDNKLKQQKQSQRNAWFVNVEQMIQVGFFQFLDINERGSNSWVISGNLTDSGHPIICNDPHLDSVLPSEFHQIKVFYNNKVGQEVYIIGGAFAGLPLVVGKTSYVSLTMTVNYVDTQDLYKQKIQGDKYLFQEKWRKLAERNEKIQVKGQEPLQYKIYETHRGPMIKHLIFKGHVYRIKQDLSLMWTGFTDADYISLVPYSHMAEVSSYNQLINMSKTFYDYGPTFNLLYSTRDDHIGYQTVGLVPIRSNMNDGSYVKDGTTSKWDWKGLIRGESLLHLQDPQRGYIVTANNKAAPQKYFNGAFQTTIFTARADRIEILIKQKIASGKKISIEDMKQIQLDTVDNYCLQVMAKMKEKMSENSKYRYAFGVFQDFDCDFQKNSITSSYYITFLQNLYELIHPDGINSTYVLSSFHHHFQYLYSFIFKNHSQAEFQIIKQSFDLAKEQLKVFFNSQADQQYKYGQLHKDLMVHRPFSLHKLLQHLYQHQSPGVGNLNTINVGIMNKFHVKDYRTNHRADIRLIISYYENSQWIVDGGTNENFFSRFYLDQNEDFMSGKYHVMDQWNRSATINHY